MICRLLDLSVYSEKGFKRRPTTVDELGSKNYFFSRCVLFSAHLLITRDDLIHIILTVQQFYH